MPTDKLNFLGINRAISDYSQQEACEELINLRPTTNGLVPVKPFTSLTSALAVSRVIAHQTSGGTKYLAIKKTSEGVDIYVVNSDWTLPQSPVISWGNGELPDDIYFASAGNYILLSCKTTPTQSALLWDGTDYKSMNAFIPDVNASFSWEQAFGGTGYPESWHGMTSEQVKEIINSRLEEIQETQPELCIGPFITAIAYKMKDGNTFWTDKWYIYDPTLEMIFTNGPTFHKYFESADAMPPPYGTVCASFFNSSNKPGFLLYNDKQGDEAHFQFLGAKVKVTISQGVGWRPDSSLVQSIEVYTSRPEFYLDVSNAYYTATDPAGYTGTYSAVLAAARKHSDMDLHNKLLYLQASIPLKETSGTVYTEITLNFGGNKLTTNKTLDVDAGPVQRFGKLLGYNARFHFYDSVKKTFLRKPSLAIEFYAPHTQSWDTPYYCTVVFHYKSGEYYKLSGTLTTLRNQVFDTNTEFTIIAPSQDIDKVWLYFGGSYIYEYNMIASTRYNYSIHTGVADREITFASGLIPTASSYFFTDEPSAINVTEQYNPFLFKVEHSYLAPAPVLDLQPQMAGMTDTSYGTYPLNVFTEKGVYALMQGTGTVLYAAFRQVSNLVSKSNSVPTGNGTFIISSGGLWLIAGERSVLLSDALHLGPHKYVRSAPGYGTVSGGASLYLSDVPFKQYVNGARLSFNRYYDELYISNTNYNYSYVLSIKYRQWFKIPLKLWQDSIGGDIVITTGEVNNTVEILDTSTEGTSNSIMVHLQSRPFSRGYMYSHIHRIVAMVRAKLPSDQQQLTVALYGSENLQDWTLLSYAQRKGGPLKFSQIRTATAARSWRYYTICIDGSVPDDTDFGPVLFDYEPVIRRIG